MPQSAKDVVDSTLLLSDVLLGSTRGVASRLMFIRSESVTVDVTCMMVVAPSLAAFAVAVAAAAQSIVLDANVALVVEGSAP